MQTTKSPGLRYLENVVTLALIGEKCIGCGMCELVCPHRVFMVSRGKAQITDRDLCMECGACSRNCPVAAIDVKTGTGCASAILYGWLTGKEASCDSGSGCC